MSVVSTTTRTSMLASQELVLPVSDAQDQPPAGGYFLDVQAKVQDIQIDGMTVTNSFVGSTVMFLFCKGSHVGKEAIPNMWTLAGQLEIKESSVPSTVSFSVPVCLGKGEVAGFYIFCKQNGLAVRTSTKDEVLIDHDLALVKCGKQIEKDQSSVYTKGYVAPKGSIFCHAMPPTATTVPVSVTPPVPATVRYETPPDLTAMSARLSKIEETLVVMVLHEAQQKQAALEARMEMQDERIAKLEQDMLARMVSFDERMTKLAMDMSSSQETMSDLSSKAQQLQWQSGQLEAAVAEAEANTALCSEIKQTITTSEDDCGTVILGETQVLPEVTAVKESSDATAAMTKYATSVYGGKTAEKSPSLDERTEDLPAPKQSFSMLIKDASKDALPEARKPSPARPAFSPVTPPTPLPVTPVSAVTSSTPSSTTISTTKATKDSEGSAVSSSVVSRFAIKSVVREATSSEILPAVASSSIQEGTAEPYPTASSTFPIKVSDADRPLDARKSSPAKLNLAAISDAGKPPEVSKTPPPDPRNSSPARMKPSSVTAPVKDKESSEKPAVSKTVFEIKRTASGSVSPAAPGPTVSAAREAKQGESEKQGAPKTVFEFKKASSVTAPALTTSSTREAKQDKESSEKPAATKFNLNFDFSKSSREAKKPDSEKPAAAKTSFTLKKVETKTSEKTDQGDDKEDALSRSLKRIAAIRGKSKEPAAETTN